MSDPLTPHSHPNNPEPPTADPTFELIRPDGTREAITLDKLQTAYPRAKLPSYAFTTDHGRHGPYALEGVNLYTLITQEVGEEGWKQVEVISADGYGNRVWKSELREPENDEPILLCFLWDGRPLPRAVGLVRLVVPSEMDNALRQIKWVAQVRII